MATTRPLGLEDTVKAFIGAIKKAGKKAAEQDIENEMVNRLTNDYHQNTGIWPKVGDTVLAFVRMGGRLAAALAAADSKDTVTWKQARPALKAVQEECTAMRRDKEDIRGRHCMTANFDN